MGYAAEESGGMVHVVNPLELQRQMRAIIDNPPMAMHVTVELSLHPSMGIVTPQKLAKSSLQSSSSVRINVVFRSMLTPICRRKLDWQPWKPTFLGFSISRTTEQLSWPAVFQFKQELCIQNHLERWPPVFVPSRSPSLMTALL